MFRCLLLFWSRLLAADGEALLSDKAVWMIVMSTPEGLELEARRGCPSVEVVPEGKVLVSVQLRNSCPVSGNGMVDNFTVDLRTGRIWTGVDVRKYIDSERLRRLRDLLGRN
jgi:hypothetical protein